MNPTQKTYIELVLKLGLHQQGIIIIKALYNSFNIRSFT